MGFLKIGGFNLGNIVKSVAPSIIKAVAPAATKMLQGVVGDLFTKGGSALSKLAGNLPGPLGGLAQKLLGKFLPKLQDMASGGIEKLIGKLADSITKRLGIPGAGNLNLPGASTRMPEIQANTPATGSSSAAATGAATGSSSAAATGGTAAPSGTGASLGTVTTPGGATSNAGSPPDPANYGDLTNQNNMQKLLKDQQAYQTAFSAMQNYWSMISNIMKANFDTLKGMNSNLR